jgi:hypothetical protein
MMRPWASFSLFLLLLAASLALNCGGGSSNRQLQSITINGVGNCCEVALTATGTYSAPPTTVNPLPTSWYIQDPTGGYQLTTQSFVINCDSRPPGNTVTAMAPVDPNAPSSGSISTTKMVTATAPIQCP